MTKSIITVTIEGSESGTGVAEAAQNLADILVHISDGGYDILDASEEKPKPEMNKYNPNISYTEILPCQCMNVIGDTNKSSGNSSTYNGAQ